jgi:hypothetical protein
LRLLFNKKIKHSSFVAINKIQTWSDEVVRPCLNLADNPITHG